jgi:hypothetical protein
MDGKPLAQGKAARPPPWVTRHLTQTLFPLLVWHAKPEGEKEEIILGP